MTTHANHHSLKWSHCTYGDPGFCDSPACKQALKRRIERGEASLAKQNFSLLPIYHSNLGVLSQVSYSPLGDIYELPILYCVPLYLKPSLLFTTHSCISAGPLLSVHVHLVLFLRLLMH